MKTRPTSIALVLAFAGFALLAAPCFGQRTSWSGNESDNWFDNDNWSNGAPDEYNTALYSGINGVDCPDFPYCFDSGGFVLNAPVLRQQTTTVDRLWVWGGIPALTIAEGGHLFVTESLYDNTYGHDPLPDVAIGMGQAGSGSNPATITVTGGSSALTVDGSTFYVGRYGPGRLNVLNGADVLHKKTGPDGVAHFLRVGNREPTGGIHGSPAPTPGIVQVKGHGSTLLARNGVSLGFESLGTVLIEDGGRLRSGFSGDARYFLIGSSHRAVVQVTGSDSSGIASKLEVINGKLILDNGSDLTISDGGDVYAQKDAHFKSAGGLVSLTDFGSSLEVDGNLRNSATISVAQAALVNVGGAINNSNGTLSLDSGLVVADRVILDDNAELIGSGVVTARIAGNAQGTITAQGGTLKIGDAAASDGFDYGGSLNVGNNTVILEDADISLLGKLTTLDGGELQADRVFIGGDDVISGHGRINAEFAGLSDTTITAQGGTLRIGDASENLGFSYAGTLNVGSNDVTLNDANQAALGKLTTLGSGELEANGVKLGGNDVLSGYGIVNASIEGSAQTTITAQGGNLILGDGSDNNGFNFDGTLNVGSRVVTIDDANNANLGKMTNLANGQLDADELRISDGDVLSGYGEVNARFTGTDLSTITATGGTLRIGDASANDGFAFAGTLNVGGNTVELLDDTRAGLGLQTNITEGGLLVADNGFNLISGEILTASGNATINGDFTNNGVINGPTAAGDLLTFVNDVNGAGNYTGNILMSGVYSPGNSPAQVSHGNLNFDATSSLLIELAGTIPGIGGYDQLLISGNAVLGGAALSVDLLNSFVPTLGESFEFLDIGGTRSGLFASLSQGDLVGNFGGQDLYIDYYAGDGNDVALNTLQPAPVPEPSSLVLLGLSGLGLLGYRRRKRKGMATVAA